MLEPRSRAVHVGWFKACKCSVSNVKSLILLVDRLEQLRARFGIRLINSLKFVRLFLSMKDFASLMNHALRSVITI